MKQYYEKQYTIIIASPFKSLVEKDYTYLVEKAKVDPDHIFDYRELKGSGDFQEMTNEDKTAYRKMLNKKFIHILTINSLLGNPGENAFLQSNVKREYLNSLLWFCKQSKRKVVFFFDEIHETVPNFQNELTFILRRWKNVTHKCFILTATFTEPTYIVAMHIAYLTKDCVKIIESPRMKNQAEKLAELELYFTRTTYSSKKDFEELDYIEHLINLQGFDKYHILSYSEKIAKELEKKLKDKIGTNLTVGSNEIVFDNRLNNIGTTFKTGVNIREKNALIIICPSQYGSYFERAGTGIFHDGVPSIVQSFARLRNGGKIIVFMPPPKNLINTLTEEEMDAGHIQYSDYLQDCLPILYNTQVDAPNLKFEDQSDKINGVYANMVERIKDEKEKYEREELRTNKLIERIEAGALKNVKPTLRPKIQYPELDNFILAKGQQLLVHFEEKYGKYTSPYIIWAAFHNQFQNCRLTKLLSHEYQIYIFETTSKSCISDVAKFLEETGLSTKTLRELSPRVALTTCTEQFKELTIQGAKKKVSCIIDGKKDANFWKGTRCTHWIMSHLSNVFKQPFSKVNYILENVHLAKNSKNNTPLIQALN